MKSEVMVTFGVAAMASYLSVFTRHWRLNEKEAGSFTVSVFDHWVPVMVSCFSPVPSL